MTDPTSKATRNEPDASKRSFGEWLRDMPRWKKIAVGAAVVTMVVGGVWSLTSTGHPPAAGAGGPDSVSGLSSNLIGGQPGTGIGATGAVEEPASKGIFRLGFSFLAGFCVGSFLRATLKIASIAIGFWLLMTFALSYYGLVNVDWTAMDSLWSGFAGNVEREWGSFQRFMTGSLPATGLAVTGLAIGLKRN